MRDEITVLLVEDEEPLRLVIQRLLAGKGLRVLSAVDAPEALAAAAGFPGQIDLVLTDVGLSGMRGPELVARLREERPRLRALYMSGQSVAALAASQALEPGAAAIAKPFSMGALMGALRQAIAD
jgi:CheY-like chemotaxis protein